MVRAAGICPVCALPQGETQGRGLLLTLPQGHRRQWSQSAATAGPHRKESIMNATAPAVSLAFAALNIDCADPPALAHFWGKVLGRPVSPGAVAGDMAVDATDPAS